MTIKLTPAQQRELDHIRQTYPGRELEYARTTRRQLSACSRGRRADMFRAIVTYLEAEQADLDSDLTASHLL